MTPLSEIRSFLIDMDGVLYRDTHPIPGAAAFITRLQQHNVPFILLTNNSTRTPEQYLLKLQQMGIQVSAEHLLTSAQATARYLADIAPPGTPMYVIGQDGLIQALFEQGFRIVQTPDVAFVVVGLDFALTYEKLRTATLAIRRGARFIASNPDRTFPSKDGLVPGCGSILAALQAATDVPPTVVGKPQPAIFRMAMEQAGMDAQHTAMVGDGLETDIAGGRAAGLTTILVLTGTATEESLASASIQPDYVFPSIAELDAAWSSQAVPLRSGASSGHPAQDQAGDQGHGDEGV